jgi:endonuclease/exonuclease/phosphatase family metal-dependent hydrolase
LRLATFNLENLDDGPEVAPPLAARIAALRPLLQRLDADVLCLQEVNAQEPDKHQARQFAALDALLADTAYAGFHRAASAGLHGPADVHNLVILSRWPILAQRQIRHDLVPPPVYRMVTSVPAASEASPVQWDRPLLHASLGLPGGHRLEVINLHLRSPLAAVVPGQKLAPFVWKSVSGWAEGFFLAAIKRAGQALEARLLADRLFDSNPDALVAVAGDLNAEARETPVRAIFGDVEDTGNEALDSRVLSLIETDLPVDKRFSVLHHGLKLMLDHLLISPALRRGFRRAAILNEALSDEYFAWLKGVKTPGSFHAPLVADFEVGR